MEKTNTNIENDQVFKPIIKTINAKPNNKITNSENDGEACRWFDENMDNDISKKIINNIKILN